jgi:hypothetical protein
MYFVVMPRVNLIVIFLTYHVYLYSINCPTVICLPSMCYLSYGETPLVNCDPGPISIILLSPVYFTHTVYFTRILLSLSTRYAHTFVSSKPVRLTISSQVGNKVFGCVVCRFRIAASKQSLDEVPYINYPKLSQTSKHHLQSHCLLFS